MALLLPISFQQGKERYERIWNQPNRRLDLVVQNTKRVSIFRNQVDPLGNSNALYIWCLWLRGQGCEDLRSEVLEGPEFWIPTSAYEDRFTIAEQRHLNWAAKQSLPDAVYQPEPPTIVDSIDDTPLFGGLL